MCVSAQGAAMSLNATLGLDESHELQEGDEYTEKGEQEEYGEEEGMECIIGGSEDEVLDLQVDESLDDDFKVSPNKPQPP